MRLYELENQYIELLELSEDPETDPQVIQDTIEALEGEMEVKAEAYVKIIKQLKADREALQKEADLFQRRANKCLNSEKFFTESLHSMMALLNRKEMDAGLFKLKVVGNGGLKPLVISGEVPEEFIKLTPSNDNDAIRKYIEEHGDCEWAHLGERGTHITIK